MMGADAKSQVGQGLSRLLNVSDGILGQGTKIMILVTTNENLGKLNPAVMRPGRCRVPAIYRGRGQNLVARVGLQRLSRWGSDVIGIIRDPSGPEVDGSAEENRLPILVREQADRRRPSVPQRRYRRNGRAKTAQ